MLGATTDVATGASELFVAMAQMEPTTAATVGVVFQVAKWFVALWKSLDAPTSDEENAIKRMDEGVRLQIKSATRELKNEIQFVKLHDSMVQYTEEVIKPLSHFYDVFTRLTSQEITEDLVSVYRDACSKPDKSGSGVLKHISVYWQENCDDEDVELMSMISFNASRVLDKMAANIKHGTAWSWKRFSEATTRVRLALAYMGESEANSVLSTLQRRVSGRSFENVEVAIAVLENTVISERRNIKP
ncbi:hypothetical protein AAVH_33052 [Aphelenchoides avenae]|nr:hypothetical protein AAVH_33052 [Aphelenchus avenae]